MRANRAGRPVVETNERMQNTVRYKSMGSLKETPAAPQPRPYTHHAQTPTLPRSPPRPPSARRLLVPSPSHSFPILLT